MTTKERDELRRAFADYKYGEGCSCCRNQEIQDEAAARLAELLDVPAYEDNSGYSFTQFRTQGE